MTFTGYVTTQRSRFVSLLGAGAIVVGAMVAAATAANAEAISESTIKERMQGGRRHVHHLPRQKEGRNEDFVVHVQGHQRRHVHR